MRLQNDCRGIALLLSVIALFVVSALGASVLFMTIHEMRIARSAVVLQATSATAEEGVYNPIARWDVGLYNGMAVGESIALGGTPGFGSATYSGQITRLNSLLYLVTTEASHHRSGARQRMGLIMRLEPLKPDIKAAVTTTGPISVGSLVRVNGADTAPTGWTCPAAVDSLPGLRIPPPAPGDLSGCVDDECFFGLPPILVDSGLNAESLTLVAGRPLAGLRTMASKVINGGTLKVLPTARMGTCVTAGVANWGDPYGAVTECKDYRPTVFSDGDLSLTGGRGQGILVVLGDLSISGGFEHYGLVLLSGRLVSSGSGGSIVGAVVAANENREPNDLDGPLEVRYSTCALERAIAASGTGEPIRERGWFRVY